MRWARRGGVREEGTRPTYPRSRQQKRPFRCRFDITIRAVSATCTFRKCFVTIRSIDRHTTIPQSLILVIPRCWQAEPLRAGDKRLGKRRHTRGLYGMPRSEKKGATSAGGKKKTTKVAPTGGKSLESLEPRRRSKSSTSDEGQQGTIGVVETAEKLNKKDKKKRHESRKDTCSDDDVSKQDQDGIIGGESPNLAPMSLTTNRDSLREDVMTQVPTRFITILVLEIVVNDGEIACPHGGTLGLHTSSACWYIGITSILQYSRTLSVKSSSALRRG